MNFPWGERVFYWSQRRIRCEALWWSSRGHLIGPKRQKNRSTSVWDDKRKLSSNYRADQERFQVFIEVRYRANQERFQLLIEVWIEVAEWSTACWLQKLTYLFAFTEVMHELWTETTWVRWCQPDSPEQGYVWVTRSTKSHVCWSAKLPSSMGMKCEKAEHFAGNTNTFSNTISFTAFHFGQWRCAPMSNASRVECGCCTGKYAKRQR